MNLELNDIDRIIEMAWEDRTPFDAITFQFKLKEQEVINLMRRELKPSSFRLWRARVQELLNTVKKERLTKADLNALDKEQYQITLFQNVKPCFDLSLEYLKTAH